MKYINEVGQVLCYCSDMRSPRKDLINQYVEKYLKTLLENYPSLYGEIHLELKDYGFVARFAPNYTIVLNRNTLEKSTSWRITYLQKIIDNMQ